MAAGLQKFVQQICGMYSGGFSSQRMLLQQSLAGSQVGFSVWTPPLGQLALLLEVAAAADCCFIFQQALHAAAAAPPSWLAAEDLMLAALESTPDDAVKAAPCRAASACRRHSYWLAISQFHQHEGGCC